MIEPEAHAHQPRRRGRPRKHTAKRASFHTRIREVLKGRLEAAAAEAGRSLSEEIEHRLEQSFRDERVLHCLMSIDSRLAVLAPNECDGI